jgi:hypothetical protein
MKRTRLSWMKVVDQNKRTILILLKEAFGAWYCLALRSAENFDVGPEVIHRN